MSVRPLSDREKASGAGQRVTSRELFGLGCGRAASDASHGTLFVLINPIYNITLGVSPVAISVFFFCQRIWDAMLDPLCGQLSDNFRSRWGRRRPLMLLASFPLAALFMLMWWFPRSAGQERLIAHMIVVGLLFYVAHSLYNVPLGGLILEASDGYHERTRIAAIALCFGFSAQILSQWVFPITQLKVFPDTITGVRWVSLAFALFLLTAALVPVVCCRERLYKSLARRQRRTSLRESLQAAATNRPFVALVLARFSFGIGYTMVGTLSTYMYIFYVFGGRVRAAAFGLAVTGCFYQIAAVFAALALYPPISRRLGKKRTFQVASLILVVGCICKVYLYQPNWAWWPIVVISANGAANAGMSLMGIAMMADVADYDEWRSGLRREGIFISLLGWFEKAGNAAGALATGFILAGIGFKAKAGTQQLHTLQLMKAWYIAGPAAGALVAVVIAQFYSLTEHSLQEIRHELERRRLESSLLEMPENRQ